MIITRKMLVYNLDPFEENIEEGFRPNRILNPYTPSNYLFLNFVGGRNNPRYSLRNVKKYFVTKLNIELKDS